MSYSLQASARMDLGENNRNTDSSHDHLEGSQARGRLSGANNNLDPPPSVPSAEGPFCSEKPQATEVGRKHGEAAARGYA